MKKQTETVLLMYCNTFLGTKISATFHKLCKIFKKEKLWPANADTQSR